MSNKCKWCGLEYIPIKGKDGRIRAKIGYCSRSCLSKDIGSRKDVQLRKSKSQKTTFSLPEIKTKLSLAAKERGARPEVKLKISQKNKISQNLPDVKIRKSVGIKKTLSTPESILNRKKTNSLLDVKRRRSLAAIEVSSRPEKKAAFAARINKKNVRDKIKATLNSPLVVMKDIKDFIRKLKILRRNI